MWSGKPEEGDRPIEKSNKQMSRKVVMIPKKEPGGAGGQNFDSRANELDWSLHILVQVPTVCRGQSSHIGLLAWMELDREIVQK